MSFDPRALATRYAVAQGLPDPLLRLALRARGGTVADRTESLATLRAALLAGERPGLPKSLFDERMATTGDALLASFPAGALAAGGTEVVDKLLCDLLEAASCSAPSDDALDALYRELSAAAAKEVRELGEEEIARAKHALSEETAAAAMRETEAAWAERVRVWGAVRAIYGEVGDALGLGWDLGTATLSHAGWTRVASLHALLESSPALAALVRSLGRLHASKEGSSTSTLVHARLRRAERVEAAPDPRAPVEMRGVERSDSLSRMLPSEAALLLNPTLRRLFHARRVEHALSSYRAEGVGLGHAPDRAGPDEGAADASRDRGPIIVLLDTSASMSGAPESVAKAVVLEAVRVAHGEGRRCWLVAFGGPGEIVEQELSLGRGGLVSLLDFLSLSFRGGTDLSEPLRRALARLATEEAKDADLLLVSDGAFPLSPALDTSLAAARAAGTRFHGLQVGLSESAAMVALCEPLHRFSSWRVLGGVLGG